MKTTSCILKAFLLGTLILPFTACNAQKRNITFKELPATAQTFIKANFPNQATAYIIEDKDITHTEYEIRFTGGAEVEFDGSGNWKEVDMNRNLIPTAIVPKNISGYLARNYKGMQVEKIEKKHYGYKVESTTDIELQFDKSGNFLRIDD
ncbi:MAG: PepSY-like domain-containing protein [Bacteroidia bacterium]